MNRDFIGDVHGHADALERLLEDLGYRETMGAWRKPGHKAMFVGDLIDRGPRQLDTVSIVRRMIEADAAEASMGNHELNAILYATIDETTGKHLRARTEKNTRQHQAYLDAVGVDSALHREHVAWFKTIPLWIDHGDVRMVHACWHPGRQAILAPHIDPDARLTDAGMQVALKRGTAAYDAVEVVLKGMEIKLPKGISFHDKDGVERFKIRTRWWDAEADTYATAAVFEELNQPLPETPLPASERVTVDDVPTFFGHFWMRGEPELTSDKRACLDFSIAKGGVLTAYSWQGEPTLDPGRLSWVGSTPAAAPTR